MSKHKKNLNKSQIKRQISEFLASNQSSPPIAVVAPVSHAPQVEQPKVLSLADDWSATSAQEIKKILVLMSILVVSLIAIFIFDKRVNLVTKIGNKATQVFGL